MKDAFDTNFIADYIIHKYPKSCLAYNGKDSGDLRQDCEDFFYFEKLNWCGCGSPNDAKRAIYQYLKIVACNTYDNHTKYSYEEICKQYTTAFGVKNVYENPLLLALAYTLDAAGFTEHGSSVGGAWTTGEGEMFLYLLAHNPEVTGEE